MAQINTVEYQNVTNNESQSYDEEIFLSFHTNANEVTTNRPLLVDKTWKDLLFHAPTTGLFSLISLWFTVALLRDFFSERDDSSITTGKKWIRILTVLCSITYTIYSIAKIVEEVVVDVYAHDLCAVSKYFKVFTGGMTLSFSYGALWMRQRSLYVEASMKHFTSPLLRVASWISCFLCIAFPFLNFALYAGTYTLGVVPTGCAIVKSAISPKVSWMAKAVFAAFIHSALLLPFIYPLIRFSVEREISGIDLKPVIVRSTVTAAVCAVTDILVYSICATRVINDGVTISVLTQVNVVMNLLMIVVAFPHWKNTVFPFCVRAEDNKGAATSSEVLNGCEMQSNSRTRSDVCNQAV